MMDVNQKSKKNPHRKSTIIPRHKKPFRLILRLSACLGDFRRQSQWMSCGVCWHKGAAVLRISQKIAGIGRITLLRQGTKKTKSRPIKAGFYLTQRCSTHCFLKFHQGKRVIWILGSVCYYKSPGTHWRMPV